MRTKERENRRKHHRLPLELTVLCHKVGLSAGETITGNSVNVSPGGILMELNGLGLCQGELLSVEMSVPPTEGLLEYGGRFSSYARVLRVDNNFLKRSAKSGAAVQRVALEFCESPKLHV